MAAKQQQKIKGNPAHKRMSNARLAIRRERSWKRGQEKKARNRLENDLRHSNNVDDAARIPGFVKPWDKARNLRHKRRHAKCIPGHACRLNKKFSH